MECSFLHYQKLSKLKLQLKGIEIVKDQSNGQGVMLSTFIQVKWMQYKLYTFLV